MDRLIKHEKLFGGVLSKILEYGQIDGTLHPMLDKALNELDKFVDEHLNYLLPDDVIEWLSSPILDKFEEDTRIFVVCCKEKRLDLLALLDDEIEANIIIGICLACKMGFMEIVVYILDNYPDILNTSYDLLVSACKSSNLELVKFLYGKLKIDFNDCITASLSSKISDIFIWLMNTDYEKNIDIEIFSAACKNNKFNEAKIIYEIISKCSKKRIYMNNDQIYNIGQGGNIEFMKWALDTLGYRDSDILYYGYRGACENGQLELAQWMLKRMGRDKEVGSRILIRDVNSLEIFKWLYTDGDIQFTYGLVYDSLSGNRLEIAQWLYENNPKAKELYKKCTYDGSNLKFIKWILSVGGEVDATAIIKSSYFESNLEDDFETIYWILKNTTPDIHVDSDHIFKSACRNGNLKLAKMLFRIEKIYPSVIKQCKSNNNKIMGLWLNTLL